MTTAVTKTYYVEMQRTVYYRVKVEAEDAGEAIEKAYQEVSDDDILNYGGFEDTWIEDADESEDEES